MTDVYERSMRHDDDHDSDPMPPAGMFDFYGDPEDEYCAHRWSFTGTADGGDDPRYHGEGRVICSLCGADGDG